LEISVPIEELRERKIFLATPMYGGQCYGSYTKSSVDLTQLACAYGVDVKNFYLFNESLITRARNYCVDEFLRSEYTHLMFIDSDIGFDPNDVLSLAVLADPKDTDETTRKEIICGPYAKKTIAWEKIVHAVNKGYGDNDPNELGRFVGDYVFNPTVSNQSMRLDQPVPVLEGGTGFMMVQRSAFEKFEAAYPELKYVPDHVRSANFDGTREIMCYFDALIDKPNFMKAYAEAMATIQSNVQNPDVILKTIQDLNERMENEIKGASNRYLSEDYMFCQWAAKIGIQTWMCPWMKLTHTGTHIYGGSLMDLATLGVAATADMDILNKNKGN
jgi:hypothetical protein